MTPHPHRGYTLVEMIVSIALFSIVVLIVMTTYITLISLDRQARASNQLAASLSFVVDSMARNIRTGSDYTCTDLSSPNCVRDDEIKFKDSEGDYLSYVRTADGRIGQCTLTDLTDTCLDAEATPLTDPKITVSRLNFYVRGVAAASGPVASDYNVQPMVSFVIQGSMRTDAGETTSFSIQTSATQRIIDI